MLILVICAVDNKSEEALRIERAEYLRAVQEFKALEEEVKRLRARSDSHAVVRGHLHLLSTLSGISFF